MGKDAIWIWCISLRNSGAICRIPALFQENAAVARAPTEFCLKTEQVRIECTAISACISATNYVLVCQSIGQVSLSIFFPTFSILNTSGNLCLIRLSRLCHETLARAMYTSLLHRLTHLGFSKRLLFHKWKAISGARWHLMEFLSLAIAADAVEAPLTTSTMSTITL